MDAKAKRGVAAPVAPDGHPSALYRYSQLALLVLAAGSIYAVVYLRQTYQSSMLVALGIDNQQLGYLYSGLGVAFVMSYLPSGWLADRLSARFLISFSMLATGALGFWYATFPSFGYLCLIFFGFGVTTGLTFWAPLLKRLKTVALKEEQGRFFGFLDGGRGILEASLAVISLKLFAHYTQTLGESTGDGFRHVILMYAGICSVLGLVFGLFPGPRELRAAQPEKTSDKSRVLDDVKLLLKLPDLRLMIATVFCAYHLFWATYSFSAYLEQSGLGFTATTAAAITTAKLWMRPFGGIGGGLLGDRFSNLRVLTVVIVLATLGLVGLVIAPAFQSAPVVIGLVLFIGLMAYAIRGLYWAILDVCNVPTRITGLAIGLVSVIAYSPDVVLPLINGWATQHFAGMAGYRIYYSYLIAMGVLGVIAALALQRRLNRRKLA
jgi:MFS family permease